MKKSALLFFVFFLVIPVSFADITITTDQHTYNLGNRIKASASVINDKSLEGLFKLTLSCDNYLLQYFLTPISLEANFRTAVNVPELTVSSSMLGKCAITGSLMTNDNLVVEEKNSNSFGITNQLTVLPVKSKVTSLPGDSIQIVGVVNEAFGSNVLKAATKISLDNQSYFSDAIDGKFNLTLEISKSIRSGNHNIEISASDSKGNSGASSVGLEITAVPSYIKTELSGNQFAPGSTADITSSLYDQADDLINTTLDLELTSPKGDKMFRKIAQSSEKIGYEFSQYAEPGLYALASTYKNLLSQSSINITTIREVKVKYENETVLIENIGNIPFEDEFTFIIESGSKKYPVAKKFNIEPGKILNIDLSKEVPLGIYNVLLPIKEGLEPLKEKINQTFQELAAQESSGNILPENQNLLAAGITIHDNRPIYKKIASGLGSISGSLVGANGLLAKNPVIAPVTLAVVLMLIIIRYGRKPIMKLVRRKKDDESEEN